MRSPGPVPGRCCLRLDSFQGTGALTFSSVSVFPEAQQGHVPLRTLAVDGSVLTSLTMIETK